MVFLFGKKRLSYKYFVDLFLHVGKKPYLYVIFEESEKIV